MSLKSITAATDTELTRAINGMVVGKTNLFVGRDKSPSPAAAPHNLYKWPTNGLTLIFATPAKTVTFVGDLDLHEILAAINTQVTSVVAYLRKTDGNGGQNLALYVDDGTPIVLSDTGTANALLGFSTTPADPRLTQHVIDPTKIISIGPGPSLGGMRWTCFYTT